MNGLKHPKVGDRVWYRNQAAEIARAEEGSLSVRVCATCVIHEVEPGERLERRDDPIDPEPCWC